MRTLLRSLSTITLLAAGLLGAEPTDLVVRDGDVTLTGHVFRPAGAGAKPAVLVVHEWWGRNAYADRRAEELTKDGYVALAVDLYGEAAQDDFPTAVARSKPFYAEPERFSRRLGLFLDAVRRQPGVDGQRVSAIGFCFGGSAVLQAARDGLDLRGVVAFHAGLGSAKPATTTPKARILVCHGGADPFVPPADVAKFFEEMTTAKASWRFEAYGGAVHAFTNPTAGQGVTNVPAGVPFAAAVHYDQAAETASLAAMRTFLADVNR